MFRKFETPTEILSANVHGSQDKRPQQEVSAKRRQVAPVLQKVFDGHKEFSELSIYVHGSWADDSTTEFSDIDDLIVYNANEIAGPERVNRIVKWLNRTDMRFCRLDPLQHHGHWIIDSDDLLSLDESYLPALVLDGATCIQGEERVSIAIDEEKTKFGLHRNIDLTLKNAEALFAKYRLGSINLYEMKCLVGSILLLPAYLFQLQGHRVSKKWAIEHAHQIFDDVAVVTLRKCESLRADWGIALANWRYRLFRFLPILFFNPYVYRTVARRVAPRFEQRLFPELTSSEVQHFFSQCRAIQNAAAPSN